MLSWLRPGLPRQCFLPELLRSSGSGCVVSTRAGRGPGQAHMFCSGLFPASYGLDDFTEAPRTSPPPRAFRLQLHLSSQLCSP